MKVVHTLVRGVWGGCSRRVGGGFLSFGGFVDI